MKLSYRCTRSIVFLLSILILLAFYLGTRFTQIPASHMSIGLSPLMLIVALISWSFLNIRRDEFLIVASVFCLLLLTGVIIYTPRGFHISYASMAASVFIVVSYFFSRALVALNVAYFFLAVSFWILAVPVIWMLLLNEHKSVGNFFVGSSKNVVSSWLIIASVSMAAIRYYNTGKVLCHPIFISFLVSLVLETRSSILVSLLAFLLLFFLRFGLFYVLSISMLLSMLGVFFIGFDVSYLDAANIFEKTKFGSHGLESRRWGMWEGYFREMNLFSFFLGVDLSYIPEIHSYSDNPHSSIFRFHSMFGVIPLAFLGLGLCFFAFRVNFLYFSMVIFVLMRASVDTLLFGIFYDVFLILIIVCAFFNNESILNSGKRLKLSTYNSVA
ncbi:hypothetical protein [Chromohalobacter israelensis]|uniref:hypothetical protein n=1 Tax=Chromohalobacter israelensis TaxID=141390 RepID=UPI000FFEF692|nr:hypothetical protein [Chromohalobacter salexigens]